MTDSPRPSLRDAIDDIEATSAMPPPVTNGQPYLIVLESPVGGSIGKLISIQDSVSVGRSREADVVIKDPSLSRRHIEIVRTDGSWIVRDLGSRNGTRVNGAEVTSIPLWPGDQISIGSTLLQFQPGGTSDGSSRRALSNSVAMWECFAATGELEFSEHVDPALGLPPSTFGRRRVLLRDCVHADDRERLLQAIAVARGGGALELELRLEAPPSHERWVVMRGRQIDAAKGVVAGTLVDITTLKRREATLSRTALVFESFLDGVALADQDGTIFDLNPAMARSFNAPRAATLGKNLFTVVPMTAPEQQLAEANAAMAADGRWMATLQTGPAAHFEVLAFPLRTDHGENAGAVWVFRDVSEKQRMAAQLVHLDRLASLGTLSAGVAHEINNPLSFILGNTEVVRDALSPAEHQPLIEALDEVIEGAHRIGTIVRDLKLFSRADTNTAPRATDVRRAIEVAIKMTTAAVRGRTKIVAEIGPVRLAHAIESRLVQVLVNLLMNAAQALPSDRSDATITIRARDERDGVAIDVDDTGTGMPPDVVARAFEPFFTTKALGGTGLGLSISHGLVTGMGGTISLRSTVGRGTTASIWLGGAVDQPDVPAAPAAPVHQGRLRVLVIDDEPTLLRTVARILSDHDVTTADGYVAAEQRLLHRRESFDVILCDLMMPDGTGMELHARLAEERPDLVTSLVFVTGGACTSQSQEFLRNTTNLQLLKPVDRTTLRRAVFDTQTRNHERRPA